MKPNDLIAASQAAVDLLVASRKWSAGELVIITETAVPEGFGIIACAGQIERLTRSGFGRRVELREWFDRVRDHSQGIPVLYSTVGGEFETRLVSAGGKPS